MNRFLRVNSSKIRLSIEPGLREGHGPSLIDWQVREVGWDCNGLHGSGDLKKASHDTARLRDRLLSRRAFSILVNGRNGHEYAAEETRTPPWILVPTMSRFAKVGRVRSSFSEIAESELCSEECAFLRAGRWNQDSMYRNTYRVLLRGWLAACNVVRTGSTLRVESLRSQELHKMLI